MLGSAKRVLRPSGLLIGPLSALFLFPPFRVAGALCDDSYRQKGVPIFGCHFPLGSFLGGAGELGGFGRAAGVNGNCNSLRSRFERHEIEKVLGSLVCILFDM